MGWKDWYCKAREKQQYKDQLNELCEVIKTHVPKYDSMLDVGCGDCRLKDQFPHVKYDGIDSEWNDFDLIKDDWNELDNADLGVSNLVLMLFDKENAKKIFDNMMNRCKWVVLYEENLDEIEKSHDEGKFYHNYSIWDRNIVVWGDSRLNKNWKWYVFKGRAKCGF